MMNPKIFLNTLNEDKDISICCLEKETIYGIEVSYKNTENVFLHKDKKLRLMAQVFNGEETASDFLNNERSINFYFDNLNDLKEFVAELLINDYYVQFITKNKKVIWRDFENL